MGPGAWHKRYLYSHQSIASCTCRSDSLFTADEGGHRIDPHGIWRTDDMEAAVRRADTNPVDTKFGPPNIVRWSLLPRACPAAARSLLCVRDADELMPDGRAPTLGHLLSLQHVRSTH